MIGLEILYPYIYNTDYTNTGEVMFSPDFYIDSVQNSKKMVANYIFKDATLNKAAHSYIDAQTKFAKIVVDNTINAAKYSVEAYNNYWYPKKEATA